MLLLAATFSLCQHTDSTNSDVDIVNPEVARGARASHWGGLERTIDLSEYGVDLDKAFNRLLGPRGIVNQIALTAVTQSLVIIAYIIGVIAFNQLKSSNSRQGGSLDGIVSFFEPFLNNQEVATAIGRRLLTVFYDLVTRTTLTFLIFGAGDTISEILETQTLAGVWSFLTDPDFGMLMIFRITIVALSFAVGFPLLALKGPIGSDLIEAISP